MVDGSSVGGDEETGAGSGRNVAGHIHEAERTGRSGRNCNIPIDVEHS